MFKFNINDYIVYGTNGVCKIVDITEKQFRDKTIEYYVLQPMFSVNSVYYVPTGKEDLESKMHRVLSAQEIRDIIKAMPDKEVLWIEDFSERQRTYKEILNRGDRTELVRLIKTLHLQQQEKQNHGKKLHIADDKLFKDAEKLLYDEFALVLDIKREQVIPFILDELKINDNDNETAKEP